MLLVAFIVMKLAGIGEVAHWYWGWVLLTLWVRIALFVLGIWIQAYKNVNKEYEESFEKVKKSFSERVDEEFEKRKGGKSNG